MEMTNLLGLEFQKTLLQSFTGLPVFVRPSSGFVLGQHHFSAKHKTGGNSHKTGGNARHGVSSFHSIHLNCCFVVGSWFSVDVVVFSLSLLVIIVVIPVIPVAGAEDDCKTGVGIGMRITTMMVVKMVIMTIVTMMMVTRRMLMVTLL